jgi:hypothetical protein
VRWGWGVLVVAVALGVLPALAPAGAVGAATMTALSAAGAPTVDPVANTPTADDRQGCNDEDDDDSPDDGATLATSVALQLPVADRLDHRILETSFNAPPDTDELLRPPQGELA